VRCRRLRAATTPVDTTASVATGADLEVIGSKVKASYGFVTQLTKLVGTAIGIVNATRVPYDCGVVVVAN
jgi:hypothetical protein